MPNDLENYHSLLAEIEALKEDVKVLVKKLNAERSKKSRYKARWEKLRVKPEPKISFSAQIALNLIHRRATTFSHLTLTEIARQSGVDYSYVKTLNTRYVNKKLKALNDDTN